MLGCKNSSQYNTLSRTKGLKISTEYSRFVEICCSVLLEEHSFTHNFAYVIAIIEIGPLSN